MYHFQNILMRRLVGAKLALVNLEKYRIESELDSDRIK